MDLLDKIDMFVSEDGEGAGAGVGTTTPDVAKVPSGTKKMFKKEKRKKKKEKERMC